MWVFPTSKREWDGDLGKKFASTCGRNRDGFFLLNHPKPLHQYPKPLLPSPKSLTVPITLKKLKTTTFSSLFFNVHVHPNICTLKRLIYIYIYIYLYKDDSSLWTGLLYGSKKPLNLMFNRKKLEDNLIKIYLQLYLKYLQNRTLSYKSMSSKKKKTLYKFFFKKEKR